jgi:hypothetical protein
MPYLKKADKENLNKIVKAMKSTKVSTAGELNFLITTLIHEYLKTKGLNYQHINDIVGALDGAKVEFQRRVVGPYEDVKIQDNGDVGYSLAELLKNQKQYK